jgi:hypothetical protein
MSRGGMPLKRALARTMASAFWWWIMAWQGYSSRPSVYLILWQCAMFWQFEVCRDLHAGLRGTCSCIFRSCSWLGLKVHLHSRKISTERKFSDNIIVKSWKFSTSKFFSDEKFSDGQSHFTKWKWALINVYKFPLDNFHLQNPSTIIQLSETPTKSPYII